MSVDPRPTKSAPDGNASDAGAPGVAGLLGKGMA
jgi:hypothetical protein